MEAQAPEGTLYSTVQKQMTYLTDLCSTPNAQNINARLREPKVMTRT